MIAHLGGTWLYTRSESSWLYSAWYQYVAKPLHLYQGGGHLGVVIFFLISGFIISHVASRETRREFAIKRLFRIFPTLVIGILLMAGAAFVADELSLGPVLGNSAQSLRDYLYSAVLLNWILTTPAALSVTWTLFTEITFYLMVMPVLPLLQRRPVVGTVLMQITAFVVIAASAATAAPPQLIYLTIYLPLLVIGSLFYLEWSKYSSWITSLVSVSVSFAAYCLVYERMFPGQLSTAGAEPFYNYILAIGGFYMSMKVRLKNIPIVFQFLANISYALYVVHLPVGILSMMVVSSYGVRFPGAFATGAAVSIIAATLVTKLLEEPMQAYCRRMLQRCRLQSTNEMEQRPPPR